MNNRQDANESPAPSLRCNAVGDDRNDELVRKLMKRIGHINPPGCESVYVDHPNLAYHKNRCVEVGFVIEHRFAFYYWVKCKQRLRKNNSGGAPIDDPSFSPPDLVTWDWHDDVGGECDFIKSELKLLDQTNEQEVALFCWAGLRQLNDGHIAPALWLNVLGNVYVIQKQLQGCKKVTRIVMDRYGKEHRVHYFRSLGDFSRTFENTRLGTGVIWDVDLDYFTKSGKVSNKRYTSLLSPENIQSLLSPDTPWLSLILQHLECITIALEPEYTGGLSLSLELYRHWESALFTTSLFGRTCRWRKEHVQRC
jgi:hypothetical protein